MNRLLLLLVRSRAGLVHFMRIAIFIVMAWIGGLKAFQYEADGIVPFVANSPLMHFFYKQPAEYSAHKNPEGKVVNSNIKWHQANGTYGFSYGLGAVIVLIGILTLAGIWWPRTGVAGGLLTFGMSLVTLSFLVTTPEVYVPALGGDGPTPQHGFPYLSGAGRLVLKDIIMMAGGLIVAADAAERVLKRSGS
ncbi:reactive chlorine resistance membrane protein RclC [Niabella drilacis]|uniref:Uncharacterized membrane protein YkgB n=1 Tax=Niabella drilacis (strain DSM 25811 / CCM 8410 / CCUG 62505 / LMG 26954 / E90) TaxID=1285928 RepID=A0A1G6L7K0_NIADE|nr:reactive chlorine resistance membrane protein RclC [Niabella drilacis]SDC39103.1 Uncharacterized membrane protein YkgB [Niabella drilacis]